MGRISKVYPSFYGGISEQSDELILDNQCRDMVNCVPDVVKGVERRNGYTEVSTLDNLSGLQMFHSYDRGEGNEEYIMFTAGNDVVPLHIYNKDLTTSYSISYNGVTTQDIYAYLTVTSATSNPIKALTVQDRTFVLNKTKTITQNTLTAPTEDYTKVAFYWLKRASNDDTHKYNYAVYLNGTAYEYASDKSDDGATGLAQNINDNATDFSAEAIGSVIKITSTLSDWTFDSWDSWGNQASFGWKGEANKLTDLPSDMPFDGVIVKVTGDDRNSFTDYFIKSENGVWIETRDPNDLRGSFNDMPFVIDRKADGTFEVSLVDWEEPHIGNEDTNPTPSFVGNSISDIFFFKNRLGFASTDSIIMSEEGGYYNFYSKTALEVIDTDPIDIAIASTKASRIYYVLPFQRSLYVFTKETQLEVVYDTTFSPLTVSMNTITSYDMDINVEPKLLGDSLFFITKTSDGTAQLREYVRDSNNLIAKGIDITINTPKLLPEITKIVTNTSLGLVIMYAESTPDTLYVYKYVTTGTERIQSSIFKFTFGIDIDDIYVFSNDLYLLREYVDDVNKISINKLPLLPDESVKTDNGVSFSSYVVLPKWFPKLGDVRTALDNVQIKRMRIKGDGDFNVDIYRPSYNTTISKTISNYSTTNKSVLVAGNTRDVELTVKNSGDNYFRITSIILEGIYKQSARELR